MNKIGITTGDKFGIGKELIKKALDILAPKKEEILIIGEKIEDLDYETVVVDVENNGEFCYQTLVKACALAREDKIKAIVTAPVSKEELHKAGHIFNGQTEVIEHELKEGNNKAEMLFIADDMRVMLLTRHLALHDIKISKEMIIEKVLRFNKFLIDKYKIQSPKIALCALNPHGGENGILGNEEIEIINPATDKLREMGINVTYPKPADALFAQIGKKYLNNQKQEYDGIISMYHDQGLTAVKALAFDKVVNTTIGLKVIRTSPSGGTAYDIAGKNIADPTSMVEAIKLAKKLM